MKQMKNQKQTSVKAEMEWNFPTSLVQLFPFPPKLRGLHGSSVSLSIFF
jgi:hypothetical protein